MADIYYPSSLPAAVLGKSRQTNNGFIVSPIGYTQKITDDIITRFNVTIVMSSFEAMTFRAWLKANRCESENPEFFMPILSEDGLQNQLVRFDNDGYPQHTTSSTRDFSYSASLICRDFKSDLDDYADLYLAASESNPPCVGPLEGANLIDIAVNESFSGCYFG